MKNKALKIILAIVLAVFLLFGTLLVGGGAWVYSHGYYHALLGGIAESESKWDEAIGYFKTAYEKNPDALMVAHALACCYAMKGDNESCFHWLEIAVNPTYGDLARDAAKTDTEFDSVRQTPEFQALIAEPAEK
ncbi:MAG: hypothetical protein WC058_09565 [Phycisphaeraceae bacterium]